MLLRRMIAGFLAGASSVLGLLALSLLLLLASGIWTVIRDVAFQVEGLGAQVSLTQALAQSFAASLAQLPGYFWSGRWGAFFLGVVGLVLAIVDGLRSRIRRPWRATSGFVATNALVTALVIGAIYANQANVFQLVAEQPVLFSQQSVLLVSDTTLLFFGILAALGLAYITWAAWQWWFERWAGWLRVSRPELAQASSGTPLKGAAPTSAADEMRAYQERVTRLRRQEAVVEQAAAPAPAERSWIRPTLVGLALATLLSYGLLRSYNGVGPAVASREMWVSADAPASAVVFSLTRRPQSLTISNAAGSGVVDIRVRAGATQVENVEGMRLAETAGDYQSTSVNLAGQAADDYRVDVGLREGRGGLLRVVALYGGGPAAQVAGAALGLALGLWIALANILLLELLAERGAYRSASSSLL